MKFNKGIAALVTASLAGAFCVQTTSAQVQIQVQRPADSTTGTARAVPGFTGGVTEQKVRDLITQTGTGGATQLPYDVPEGSYYNNATYPLQLAYTAHIGGGNCGGGYIIVGGAQVATASDGCDGGDQFMTAIVPAKTSFSFGKSGYGDARMYVTAMANGATWQATGVLFSLGESFTASLQTSNVSMPYYFCYVSDDWGGGQYIYSQTCNVRTQNTGWYGYLPGQLTINGSFWPAWNGGVYGQTSVTTRSCNWTRRSANNWGQTTVTGSGAIAGWPGHISCDGTNVAHYYASTGPFTPAAPDPGYYLP